MGGLPTVSIIVPCRNEEQYLASCLDSILASDYPLDLMEVLVVDGMSEDSTPALAADYAARYPAVQYLENPARIAPAAQNLGLDRSGGDVVVIMDAHARYAPDYVSKCVSAMNEYDVDFVGGVIEVFPQKETAVGHAIVMALSHRFGVGGALYRTRKPDRPTFTDAAVFGFYRREVFDRVGRFDESMARSYDFELNARLRKTGRGILLVPDAVVYYYARSDLSGFLRVSFSNGFWVTHPLGMGKRVFSLRHLIPMGFVTALAATAVASAFTQEGQWALAGLAGTYLVANLAASVHAGIDSRRLREALLLPGIFAGLHVAYGLGSLWGLASAGRGLVARLTRKAGVTT